MKGKILLKKKDVSNSNNNVTQLLHEKNYHETNNSDETIIENWNKFINKDKVEDTYTGFLDKKTIYKVKNSNEGGTHE